MASQFTLPHKVIFGKEALRASEAAIKELGKRALIVTGKNITKSGIVGILTDYLEDWRIGYEIFNDITGEPTVEMIEAGVKAYQEGNCDFLIAIGGGSPLDSGKAIAAMTVLPGRISDYMGKEIKGVFPPTVLIPTTAGTGSEATKYTIITDNQKNIKMLLKGDDLLPKVAILDVLLTMSAPATITAATGMDALTHAVESYTSRKGNTLTDIYAVSAIKRIFQYLPKAYEDGNDVRARQELQIAAYEAGVCINNASVTLVHGMSRPIGALFHVPHGISNAMLIVECLSYVLEGCFERFATLAKAIGVAKKHAGEKEAAKEFIKALASICRLCQIPTLAEYGISKEEFDAATPKMAEDAMASGSPGNTIKEVDKNDLIKIYQRLW